MLDIPVFHDDQHGTAVVVLAALINVSRLLKRALKKFKVVVVGAGAAGSATARILLASGVKDIIVCDKAGAVYQGRKQDMDPAKRNLAKVTNPRKVKGSIADAMKGADVFIGLSAPNIITPDDIRRMSKDPVVFALANPDPEIAPEEAHAVVRVMATGRSDYPNQINNMLGFPGIFRGLLDVRATGVNEAVKLAAAKAIAHTVGRKSCTRTTSSRASSTARWRHLLPRPWPRRPGRRGWRGIKQRKGAEEVLSYSPSCLLPAPR